MHMVAILKEGSIFEKDSVVRGQPPHYKDCVLVVGEKQILVTEYDNVHDQHSVFMMKDVCVVVLHNLQLSV